MLYNWQQEDWTAFRHDPSRFEGLALLFQEKAGHSTGILSGLSQEKQDESLITILVKEAMKTSAIEGELISRADVISSIKKNLGFPTPSVAIKDQRSAGIAGLLVQSRTTFADDLNAETIFTWHRHLMQGSRGVAVGAWRTHEEPMQVVSGAMGLEQVHFEAPPSASVPSEMERFFEWFRHTAPSGARPVRNPLIRSAVAHLYFESIHPFEDGNGRIGRIIAEKALSQHLGSPVLLSLSACIEANKKAYYNALQAAQRTNDCDAWIQYFAEIVLQAQSDFVQTITFSVKKARFFDTKRSMMNPRQLKVIARMLEEGEDGFTGGMNAKKYQSISQTSKATATRDLQELVEKGILTSMGRGRSTNYQVAL